MSLNDWIKQVFDAPSRRRDKDYSKEISRQAMLGVILVYRDYLDPEIRGFGDAFHERWMAEVVRELGHLHHSFAAARPDEGFRAIVGFLENSTPVMFLDFLEVSLRHGHAPNNDNDFLDAVNRVLDEYDSPYLLTRYGYVQEPIQGGRGGTWDRAVTFPRAYLKQDAVVQQQAIKPALEIFSDPAYATPAEDFHKALRKQKDGDYDGCVASCASSVEGTIKVVAAKNGWKVKGTGLDTLAQSFTSKSSLPDTMRTSVRPLSDWRNTKADAHGHATKEKTTFDIAQHFVALAASLVVLVQSEAK